MAGADARLSLCPSFGYPERRSDEEHAMKAILCREWGGPDYAAVRRGGRCAVAAA